MDHLVINLRSFYLFDYFLNKDYAKSKSNLLDGIIVVISIVDLIGSSMDYKINIIRSLRILRVTRILRPLEYMIVITRVIVNKFYSFIYIYLLLILFMIIYTLIGNQIYINQLNPELTGIRQNFNTFYSSFLSVFQLVSMENWNDIETTTLNSNIPYAFTIFYLLSLIFFGNYVFLNLLLGVLLDGFSNINKLEEEDENNSEITLSLEELNRFKEIHHDDDDEKNDDILQNNEGNTTMNRNGRKNPTIQMNLDEEDIKRFLHLKKQDNDEKTFENPWELWHSEETLWYFKKSSWVRRISYIIVKSEYFNYFIYFLIFANSIKLARDTYLEKDTGSFIFEYILGGFLVGEAILKIIAFGFIFGKYTYLKNYWNVLDFFVVGATLADMTLTNYNLNYIKVSFLNLITYYSYIFKIIKK